MGNRNNGSNAGTPTTTPDSPSTTPSLTNETLRLKQTVAFEPKLLQHHELPAWFSRLRFADPAPAECLQVLIEVANAQNVALFEGGDRHMDACTTARAAIENNLYSVHNVKRSVQWNIYPEKIECGYGASIDAEEKTIFVYKYNNVIMAMLSRRPVMKG
jgi:hypothetical protein